MRAAARRTAFAPRSGRPLDRWAAWRAWRRLAEAAIAAAGAPEAYGHDLVAELKATAAVRFPVEGASAAACSAALRGLARAFFDAAPSRRALIAAAMKGAGESVWALIEDAASAAGRPPHWLED